MKLLSLLTRRPGGVVVTDRKGDLYVARLGANVSIDDGVIDAAPGGAGTGDVVGPASAVDDRIATFDGTTGKLIQDGGATIAGVLATAAAAAATADAALFPIDNTELADMAQATLKGRAAGAGTGDPQDLTGTQATAILDALVGDSGSGGTKGLAPAPAAGDAAAGKFLKADGTWAVPPGGGGSGITELTGDVTAGPGTGTQAATLAADAVTNAKLADMAQATIKGRAAGAGTGDPQDLTASQVRAIVALEASVGVGIDGDGAVIPTGAVARFVVMPFAMTITGYTITADQSGSCVIDVWKAAGAIPTNANSITASAPPTLSSAQFVSSATLTGWTLSVAAGDVFGFEVDSAATVEAVTLQLFGTRT